MNTKKKRNSAASAALVVLVSLFHCMAFGAETPPEKGGVLPEILLPVPEDPDNRSYLGLEGGEFFKIPQIEAKAVIIEIFSMYCPHCQREAPEVNKLYTMIEDNPNTKNKIKLIGIGPGNSAFEVDMFRQKYNVPFPLFSDEDYSIHKLIGEVRTPYFIAIKIHDNGTHQVTYSKLGGLEGAGRFLDSIIPLIGSD